MWRNTKLGSGEQPSQSVPVGTEVRMSGFDPLPQGSIIFSWRVIDSSAMKQKRRNWLIHSSATCRSIGCPAHPVFNGRLTFFSIFFRSCYFASWLFVSRSSTEGVLSTWEFQRSTSDEAQLLSKQSIDEIGLHILGMWHVTFPNFSSSNLPIQLFAQ